MRSLAYTLEKLARQIFIGFGPNQRKDEVILLLGSNITHFQGMPHDMSSLREPCALTARA
jgi:hypothetical protein